MDRKEIKKETPDKSSDSATNSSDHNYSTSNGTNMKLNSVSSSNSKDDENVVSQGRAKKRMKGTNENVSSSSSSLSLSSSKISNTNEQVSTSASSSIKKLNAQRYYQNKKEAQSTTSSPNQISSSNSKDSNSDKMDADQSFNNTENEYASSTSENTSHIENKKSNPSSTSSSIHSSLKDSSKDNQALDNLQRVPPLRIVINNSNSNRKESGEKVSSSGLSIGMSLSNNSQIHSTTNSERMFSVDSNPLINVTSSSTTTNTSSTASSSILTSTNSIDEYDGEENASSSTRDLTNSICISTGRVTRSQKAAQQTTNDEQSINETISEVSANNKNLVDSNFKDLRKRKNRFKVNQSIKQQHSNEDDDNDSTSSSNSSINNREQLNQLINNQLQCLEKKQLFQMPSYNCYHLYLNIRRQVDNRRTQQIHLVHPKIPENFNQFLFNTGSYLLDTEQNKFNSIQSTSGDNVLLRNDNLEVPQKLNGTSLYSLFIEQEQERHKLILQHRIERDKLRLSAEQEILRVYSRAELAMTNLNLPLLSACTVLKDEEIYNSIDDENLLDNDLNDDLNVFANLDTVSNDDASTSNKSNNFNANTKTDTKFLNVWLQNVTDKWIKIKRDILLRQRREAESLQAVQKLNWSWKGKDLSFEEFDDSYVPIINVEDFHLFPIQNF